MQAITRTQNPTMRRSQIHQKSYSESVFDGIQKMAFCTVQMVSELCTNSTDAIRRRHSQANLSYRANDTMRVRCASATGRHHMACVHVS